MGARRVTRRAFLAGTAATAAAGWSLSQWDPARGHALLHAQALAVAAAGTTLELSIVRASPAGYSTLVEGPGWPTVSRAELGTPQAGREDRRVPLATIAHLTDIHVVDAQSPGRVEWLDLVGEPFTAAFRPHETLTCHVQSSMVHRLNALARGPITGRAIDCAVSTGDNIDNQQWNELEWFLRVLDGGTLAANSGVPGSYEGVQHAAWADARYWHPDTGAVDDFKTVHGFPDVPGLLDAAVAPFTTPALQFPWYSTYGNHDGLVQGNLPRTDTIDQILTGGRKITDCKPGQSPIGFVIDLFTDVGQVQADLTNGVYPQQAVTPDADRRTVRTHEWVQAHLDSPAIPGPVGHGYREEHLDLPALYYAFEIAPGVLGVSLDTGGYNSGSIGQVQLDWLEATLRAAHGRYFDEGGSEVTTGHADQLCVVFSHFNMRSMTGAPADPTNPGEARHLGDAVTALLLRFPNVVAWVNGHHHVNEIQPIPDPSGRSNGFWDINTCSHVDWPQQARLVELVDNRDGTLSIFGTMVEHLAPAASDPNDHSVLGLAAINRELAANDPQSDLVARLGQPKDLNVELVLPAPFDLSTLGPPSTTTSSTTSTTSTSVPLASSTTSAPGVLSPGAAPTTAGRDRGRVSDPAPATPRFTG